MKAVVCDRYGPPEVLRLTEINKPIPGKDQLSVRVIASAVTQSDLFIRGMDMPSPFYKMVMRIILGYKKPRNPVLGIVFAGEIDTVGAKIKRFKPGDKVYGMTGFRFGCYAEYLCMKETDSMAGCISLMPSSIDFDHATSAAYGGLLALQYLEEGNIKTAKKVLIYGAAGTSGTIAVQIAKHHGAYVTAVCRSENFNLLKTLGADRCIDYTLTNSLADEDRFDLVLDAVGTRKTSALKMHCKTALTKAGNYVSIDGKSMQMNSKRLNRISEMVDSGVFKPVLDRIYPLEEIVDAHEYVEKGHKKGGVSIHISGHHA